MTMLVEILVSAFLVIGGIFVFVGSFGLAKLPDTMRRLHGPTKTTTLGIGSLLIASMLYFVFLRGASGVHELLVTLFLFLSAPVTANMIAKAHIFRNEKVRPTLPQTVNGDAWATVETAARSKADDKA